MENYIGLNVSKLAEKENLSKDAFGRLFDLKRGAISSYIDGKALPKIETLQKISAHYNVSIDDLINRDIEQPDFRKDESIEGVPYWDLPVSAGHSITDIIGQHKPNGFIKGLPGADIAENILPVLGASMEPEVSNGALIGVRRINNWESLNTERIYLIITKDDRMIKRIEYDTENEDILWCISPNYAKFKIFKYDIVDIQRVCFVYNPK
ncbi:helix-turn-helix domain-containing protein [Labilibaculum sp.]|uniref:helix-turn-helix domain-containing protein n=1 Tax=Labilibaculum sp. TaxID=2060723 RepID=UPI003568EC9A